MTAAEDATASTPDADPSGRDATASTSDAASSSTGPQVPHPVRHRMLVLTDLGHPFRWGFLAAVGALTAWVLGTTLGSLSTVIVYIGLSIFLALALDPMVKWLERHRMSRALAIVIVLVGLALVFAALLAIVLPTAIEQVAGFSQTLPVWIGQVQESEWFHNLLATLGTEEAVDQVIDQVRAFISDPNNLLAFGGGVLRIGSGLVSGLTGAGMTFIITLYFLITLHSMRVGLGRLLPAYARPAMSGLVDRIAAAIGSYMTGMLIMGGLNAIFSFALLTVLGIRFAALLAVLALFITMIPLVGPLLFLILAGAVCFLSSPWTGLVWVLVYFAYTQFEAYVITPRVMNKQISIPGSLTIIGALIGATLLGLLGALVSVPVTATILMVLEQFVIPKQDAKLVAPEGSGFAGPLPAASEAPTADGPDLPEDESGATTSR